MRDAAVGQRDAQNDRFGVLGQDPGVDQAQHEGGEREGPETERGGIGDNPDLLGCQFPGDRHRPRGGIVEVGNEFARGNSGVRRMVRE